MTTTKTPAADTAELVATLSTTSAPSPATVRRAGGVSVSATLGIYSPAAGGIIDAPLYTEAEATAALARWVEEGEDPTDLSIVPVCPLHTDDPVGECACDEDDEDDDDEDVTE